MLRMNCSVQQGGIACESMADDQDITPAILLQHMQGMEQRLRSEFRTELRTELRTAIAASEERLVERIGAEVRHSENRVTAQIDAIDRRLDELEIALLPKRVTKLEEVVGIAA